MRKCKISELVLGIIIMMIFWIFCIEEVINYLECKDRTIKVEATVVDSINYIKTSFRAKYKNNRNNYYSTVRLQWKVKNRIQ